MENVRCQECGREYPKGVDICGACNTAIASGPSLDGGLQERAARTRIVLDEWRSTTGGDPPDPFPLRQRTLVVAAAGLAGSILTWTRSHSPVVTEAVGGTAALVFVLFLMLDLLRRQPSRCNDPRLVLGRFFECIGRDAFDAAFTYWLAEPDKREAGVRSPPRLPEFDVRGAPTAFTTPEGFVGYWSLLPKLSTVMVGAMEPIAPGYAIVDVSLTFRWRGVDGWSTRKDWTARVNLNKLLVERAGRWWLANGELDHLLDMAVAALVRTT